MKTIIKPFIFLLFLFILISLTSLACNLPINQAEGLTISRNKKDDSVSGKYRAGDQLILFSVTADGIATFETDNSSNADKVVVDMRNETNAFLNWQGMDLDGVGELSTEEQQALQNLLVSQLSAGISMIPLDAGCQGDEIVDDKQLAALLFPLQMQFKYQISDRTSKATELIKSSHCDYGLLDEEIDETNTKNVSSILLSASNPIPVVLGYFPFDEVGAIVPTYSQESGDQFACLNPLPLMNQAGEIYTSPILALNLNGSTPILDEFGPCQATCRGACGPDCTTKNCEHKTEFRCEKDASGNNTGLVSIIHVYECGVHPACIAHDTCYDTCNIKFGCGTWNAAYCRHGGWGLTEDNLTLFNELYGIEFFCDKITVTDENYSDVRGWVKGSGPQPLSQVYEYTDEIAREMVGQKECPPPSSESQEEPPPPAPEPPKVPAPLNQPPAYIEPQFVTAVTPPVWLCGGIELPWTIEFWNVGSQGGDEYSMFDMYANGCDHDVVTETTHWYGTFEGGLNGKFTFYDGDFLDCRLTDGEVVSCSGFTFFDEEITLPFEVLNPEAFDDWR